MNGLVKKWKYSINMSLKKSECRLGKERGQKLVAFLTFIND